jgi:apolipoprotein D and lipocalin family protein
MNTHQTHRRTAVLLAAALALLGGCAVSPDSRRIPAHGPVDLQAFMGRWYVIASIPTFIEKGAHNAIESYALDPDGSINTTFTFRADGFDGKEKRYNPRGFVVAGSGNAVWGMRFVWPIRAEYVICWVDPQYSETIIGRSARDYVWIMARTPTLSAERYEALLARVRDLGYDVSKVQKVPQRW